MRRIKAWSVGDLTVRVNADDSSNVIESVSRRALSFFLDDPEGEQADTDARRRVKVRQGPGTPSEPVLSSAPVNVEALYDAIRDLRATRTPSAWSDAERRLFGLLPEGTGS